MASQSDHYVTLGVSRSASAEEIRKAYRRLARKCHPDLNPGDKASEERFKKIQEAYDILSDPKKKQMFDQYGFYSETGFPGAGAGGARPGGPGMNFGGFDFSEFMAQATGGARPQGGGESRFGHGFKDMFSQFFGGQGAKEPAEPERGADLEYALNIDFWQSIRGTQVRLNVNRHETCAACRGSGSGGGSSAACPQCNGTGNVAQMVGAMKFNLGCQRCGGAGRLKSACPACHGDGRVVRSESVEVRIPAGALSGARLRVAGKGNAGSLEAPAGDLYITVRVEPHPFFRREGDNIEIQIPVTVSEAALGAKIEVPTIDGRSVLKIPQGTHNGQKFRLREKGVENTRRGTRGDQIVEVVLQAPKANDERVREILRELAHLNPEDPRADIWAKV
ncbi:MAG: J domain-containing protein [Acidobacteria bacterium]|nr:J domain-containing protein [Acidobacteriota bacterium]